jgi:hypothetical protein
MKHRSLTLDKVGQPHACTLHLLHDAMGKLTNVITQHCRLGELDGPWTMDNGTEGVNKLNLNNSNKQQTTNDAISRGDFLTWSSYSSQMRKNLSMLALPICISSSGSHTHSHWNQGTKRRYLPYHTQKRKHAAPHAKAVPTKLRYKNTHLQHTGHSQ